jgi:hypothetical protein
MSNPYHNPTCRRAVRVEFALGMALALALGPVILVLCCVKSWSDIDLRHKRRRQTDYNIYWALRYGRAR